MKNKISQEQIKKLYNKLEKEASQSGYFLNPDIDFVDSLMEGLLINKERYGYLACPCRLASGIREKDLDIICPCDYRDPDLEDYGSCYCALYVSKRVYEGNQEAQPIPERRNNKQNASQKTENNKCLPYPVYRCKVCGYLCAREHPPGICPICKAEKDRFERFI